MVELIQRPIVFMSLLQDYVHYALVTVPDSLFLWLLLKKEDKFKSVLVVQSSHHSAVVYYCLTSQAKSFTIST